MDDQEKIKTSITDSGGNIDPDKLAYMLYMIQKELKDLNKIANVER